MLRNSSLWPDLEAEPERARHCHQQHQEAFTECVQLFVLALSDQRTTAPIQPFPAVSCSILAVLMPIIAGGLCGGRGVPATVAQIQNVFPKAIFSNPHPGVSEHGFIWR